MPTGKIYIGVTIRTMRIRFIQHFASARALARSRLHVAMNTYSRDLWSVDVIGCASTLDDLLMMERSSIASHKSNDPSVGYNTTVGGQGTCGLRFKKTALQIEKSAKFHRGRKRSDETKALIAAGQRAFSDKVKIGQAVRAAATTANPQRDIAIAAEYFRVNSLRLAGVPFSIKGPAVWHAMNRVRSRLKENLSSAHHMFDKIILPRTIHPDWLDQAI